MNREEYERRQLDTWAKSKPIGDWRKQMKNPKSNAELLKLVSERCKPHKGKALDLGCGEGYHTVDLISMGYDAVGIDMHPKRIADGKTMGRSVYEGDMHNLGYDDESFDLVFAHEVIEHSFEPDKVLFEIYRVMKFGGFFAFSLPAERHWKKDLTPRDNHTFKTTVPEFYKKLMHCGLTNFEIRLYALGSIAFKGVWAPDCGMNLNFNPHLFVTGTKV